MRKWVLILFLALAVATRANPGWCGQDVTIKARPELAGIYKIDRPVPVRVDIENTGEGFRGRLEVAFPDREGYSGRQGVVYVSELDVPAGGKMTRQVVIPGEMVAGNPMVRLVAGGSVLAETRLEGTGLSGGLFILPLSDKFTGSSLFTWLDKKYGGEVTVKHLPPGELPENPLFLGAADVIVVDREAAARMGPGQVSALKDWVRLGGTLFLSGEDGTVAGGPFSDINPAGKGDSPAFARLTLGRGEVFLFRTSIEKVDDREGKAWEALGPLSRDQRSLMERTTDLKYALTEAGSYFPMVKLPGVTVVALLWAVYALVAGPGLYLVLKRLNRRDTAWVLVPALAVLAALGFYTLSPVNRLQAYLAHTTATLDIVDEGLAEISASSAFVLPRGGRLEISGDQMLMEPVNAYSGRQDRTVEAFNDGNRSRVVFNGVEYGSMRQVQFYGISRESGSVAGSVFFREDRLMGEISNNTPYHLRDCRILAGKYVMEIGDFAAGESKKLNEPLSQALIVTDTGQPPGFRPASPVTVIETRLFTNYAVRRDSAGEVYFLGWSDSVPDQLKVVTPSGQGQSGGLVLVRQKIDLDFPGGPFRLPAGFIRHTFSGQDGSYGYGPEGLIIHRGAVRIIYDLPKTLNTHNFRLTGIEVPPVSGRASCIVEIYRQDTSEWEPVDGSGQRYTGGDALRYLSREGKIEIKLTSPAEKDEVVFRGIAVEGVIAE